MTIRVGINGFGRIGRNIFRAIDKDEAFKDIEVVAINDLTNNETTAHLLKYDSIMGVYERGVAATEKGIAVDGRQINIYNHRNPADIPWSDIGVDYVIESTGFFIDRKGASKHLKAGAKKVLISAPAKNPDITIILGVNEKKLKKSHNIISMGSCTTNCLAPIVKVLNDKFGIKKGFMTTIHAYTSNQNVLDGPHKKLRRGRTAGVNLVPTTSGATTSVVEVIPSLKGKIDGMEIRAPVACGSISDFVATLGKSVTTEEVNKAMKNASKKLKGILEYTEDEIVSSDIIGNSSSSIFDSKLTKVNGNMVKVLSWYDNEYGYSCRMVDLIKILKNV